MRRARIDRELSILRGVCPASFAHEGEGRSSGMNVEEIFYETMKIASQAERAAYLDRACGRDARVREEVEALLVARDQASSFLETPAAVPPVIEAQTQDSSCMATLPPPAHKPIAEGPGTIVGRYKLLQEIGEGGMGVVYMAEQQKPVRRRVALKIIKPGMDSAQVIARFEAERQALAMMDHPNIARVLDAGCTDTGRPYFVMELVQGIPVTKYCDEKGLDTRERLELFVQVCNAVQHAHQKGIIHRDLKPSNVLVAIYDSKPVPKIIDFGVAKALHQRLTEATMFTQFGAVVGTLEYMSPEQAEMDALGTDTRSDIYSLGVLLYELLTGTTPMDGKKLRALGYAEMLKTIREVDPPKPSTRLSQSRQDMANISARRHTEPRRLQKLIAGDLDWIVMKCLEKDRTRRYETANGLAMDIQRHINDEAVMASPPGSFYKLQKLMRRNKLAFAAIGCVMAALVIGLVTSLWQFGRAQREADRANAALGQLRAAAPSIAAEARGMAAKEKFDEAIDKLNYALQLQPDSADYLLHKADLLETQLRMADAAAVYRAAQKLKPDDARAKENAELCEQLAAAPRAADGKLTRESLARLNAQMLKDQRPATEIMPVARLLGDEKKYVVSYWLERLKDLPNGTDKPLSARLTVREDGLLELDLSDTQIADLAPLAGMPLGELKLKKCTKVTDLSPLRGMPLTNLLAEGTGVSSVEPLRGISALQKLDIGKTPVSDLSPLSGLRLKLLYFQWCPVTSLEPLRGMPLERLNIARTGIVNLSILVGMPLMELDASSVGVTDFTPLVGLPLEILILQGVRVGDLGFLKGLPLKHLVIANTISVHNLAVLSEIRTLEALALPDLSSLSVADFTAVENLRNHPSIKQLAVYTPIIISIANAPSKDEFWKNWDRDYAWALRLSKAGVRYSAYRQADGTWYLWCNGQPLSDLSILAGAGISMLTLDRCKVSDLTPLKGMPLTSLVLANNPVEDLSPLRGIKLERLSINGTAVRDLNSLQGTSLKYLDARCDTLSDVAPLAGFPDLEHLILPIHAAQLDPLRQLPKLKGLSFSHVVRTTSEAVCTADAFWKTWDGLPWARKLEAAGIAFEVKQTEDGSYGVTLHDPSFTDCSFFKGSNVRRLDLDNTLVADLTPLADLPLVALSLRGTPLSDLAPLRSKVLRDSLQEIVLYKTRVADFSPIAGCTNLSTFDVSDTDLKDLSCVKGMKLRHLRVSRTAVTNIEVLAGMPLEIVVLSGTAITDISPLLQCPNLTDLALPQDARDIISLRALPKLARISYTVTPSGAFDQTADQFWSAYQGEEAWIAALRKTNIPFQQRRLGNKSWDLILNDQPISDLSMLKGANITKLSIMRTQVSDLSPLRGMKLTTLLLLGTKVSDLSPIKGMPITSMNIGRTEIRDLSPLAGMPLRTFSMSDCEYVTDLSPLAGSSSTLESLILPKHATDIEFLRKFPRLARLSYKYDTQAKGPSMTAKEFWAAYDKAPKTPASQPADAP
jgi:Leucine-rich repeat (LRR) protein/tRNA A-37 threonylcarbamoyl transferase component Bud32